MNGIAALHRAGIIHCGIKPDRIIILNDSTMKLLLDTGTLRKFSIKDTSLPVIFDKQYGITENLRKKAIFLMEKKYRWKRAITILKIYEKNISR